MNGYAMIQRYLQERSLGCVHDRLKKRRDQQEVDQIMTNLLRLTVVAWTTASCLHRNYIAPNLTATAVTSSSSLTLTKQQLCSYLSAAHCTSDKPELVMASVVEDVKLVDIAGHCYRQRTQPIMGSRSRDRAAAAAHTPAQDWQVEEELEILTLEDEQIDESLINQEGDSYVTQLSIDAQVSCVSCQLS